MNFPTLRPRIVATSPNEDTGDVAGRVGVIDGAIGGPERFASLAALFPHLVFEAVGPIWPDPTPVALDILIVRVAADSAESVEFALTRLAAPSATRVVVVLDNADVTTTRRLVQGGAADVLTAPINEAALALCLERVLPMNAGAGAGNAELSPAAAVRKGEVVALLKAGGGVGATALASQLAALLAGGGKASVCLVDLDLQFGAAALYLDLPQATTIFDMLSMGPELSEAPFAEALTAHGSGARLMAAPSEIVSLETLAPSQIDSLMAGLRRDFSLVLVDLPSVWTAWTNQVLVQADRIVLVTSLSVPHIHLVKRQLAVLAAQDLGHRPLILVCNGVSADQQASVSIKAAERALGRAFDVVIPEDRRVMTSAINQGVELAAVRRGTKLEKAIGQLADRVAPRITSDSPVRVRR